MQLVRKPAPGVAVDKKVEAKKGGLGALFGVAKKPKDVEAAPTGFSAPKARSASCSPTQPPRRWWTSISGCHLGPAHRLGQGRDARMVQKFAPDMFTDAALNAADADLAKLTKA